MSLQEIISEINKIKVYAEQDVLEVPRETLGGRLSRQRKAKEDLKSLTESYRQSLLSSATFVLVVGSDREAFINVAVKEFGFLSNDSDTFYAEIASAISPQLYENREASSNILEVVSRVLENKALDIGITGYPMLTFRQEFHRQLKNKADFVAFIKQAVNVQVGAEVVGVQAVKSVLKTAIDGEFGKPVSILLSVSDENSVKDIFTGLTRLKNKVGLIVAGKAKDGSEAIVAEGLTKSAVGRTLETLKSKITGKPANYTKYGSDESVSLSASAVLTPEVIEEAAAKAYSPEGPYEFAVNAVEKIELSEVDMANFVENIANPPLPTEALIKAVKKYGRNQKKTEQID